MIAATGAHLVDTALTQCFAGHSGFLFRAIAVVLSFVTASGVYLGGCFVMKMPEALAMIALLPGQRRRPL
jgi:4-amino-4-deoxy-L-arabinose transferase-like glycosyltransferase